MEEQKPITEAWVAFAGILDLPISRGFVNIFTKAIHDNIKTLHLLIQSQGGDVNEGIFLYNLIQGLPMDVIAYNCGFVGSAATTAYLGAKKRVVSKNGAFMIHKVTAGMVRAANATANSLPALTNSVILDDARSERILQSHLTLTPEQWTVHAMADLHLSADEAVTAGLAHEVGEFAPRGIFLNV